MEDDNSYMTWDTKYGEFDDRPETIDYVVSSPRSEMLRGLFVPFFPFLSYFHIHAIDSTVGMAEMSPKTLAILQGFFL